MCTFGAPCPTGFPPSYPLTATAQYPTAPDGSTSDGSARAHAVMTVAAAGEGSRVTIATDYSVAGRVAQFGRGVMEDVSRRLVSQMAACIKSNLEGGEAPAATEVSAAEAPAVAEAAAEGSDAAAIAAAPASPAQVASRPLAPAKPVNALSLFFLVLWDRIRRLFGAKPSA